MKNVLHGGFLLGTMTLRTAGFRQFGPLARKIVPLVTGWLTRPPDSRYEVSMTFKRPVSWLWLFLVFTAIGIFFTFHQYLDDVTWHRYGTLRERALEEMTGAYGGMVLVPFLAWIAARFPFKRGLVVRALAGNVGGYVVYTIAHTTINAVARTAISPLIGNGPYDYGDLFFRYPMEAAGDAVYYALLIATMYLLDRFIATRNLETKLAQAQLENLRLQLQPHFLFNTLNAISSVMYEDVGKADRMLAQVSDYMRLVLASGGAQEISLDEELHMEQMYVDIMKTRLDRNLALDVRVAADAHDTTVPFMLLQPLLENSIRHGMGSSRSSIQLAIDVARANGSTVIRVSDNGLGFDASAPRGIGLSNVTARLQHLYGSDATFEIGARDGGGTLAVVSLPC
jgi:two-component system, LytTR family, sensor kinase